MFVTVVLNWVEVALPAVVYRTPPIPEELAPPPTQMFVPSVVIAARGLFVSAKSLSFVEETTIPFRLITSTMRLTVAEAVLDRLVAPPVVVL